MDELGTMNTRNHSNQRRDTNGQPSLGRRRALIVAGGFVLGLAGCLRPGTSAGTIGKATGSVFEGTSFEGPDLLVHLREDHGVSSINLIGPGGEAYRTVRVETGETTVRIPILRIDPGRYEHYTPGNYKLIAEIGERTDSLAMKLVPELKIVDVKQHSGNQKRDYGNLEVTMRNSGTGPTWVYSIGYQGAPNFAAENLGENPGNPVIYLKEPRLKNRTILQPDTSETFVGRVPPLIFYNQELCNDRQVDLAIIAKSPIADIQENISVQMSGNFVDIIPGSIGPQYVCETVAVME